MANTGLTIEEMEKIKLLSAEGLTFFAISKQINRSPHTIKKYLCEPEIQLQVKEKKQDLISLYESLAERMITSIDDKDIMKLNALQRTIASATATDKARLLKGESTSHVSIIMKTLQELKEISNEE